MEEAALTLFRGREIKSAIIAAVEAVDRDSEIVTFKAGENMPITAGIVTEDSPEYEATGMIPEYAWNGEKWEEIGYL